MPLHTLSSNTQASIRKASTTSLSDSDTVRPLQATLPMGFSWAVYVSQHFAKSLLKQSFNLFISSSLGPTPSPGFHFLGYDDGLHEISKHNVVVLRYIDDVNLVVRNWPHRSTTRLQHIIKTLFDAAGISQKPNKSSPPGTLETDIIQFIDWDWDLRTHAVYANPEKLIQTSCLVQHAVQKCIIKARDWIKVIGKIIWLSLGARPLLSTLGIAYSIKPRIGLLDTDITIPRKVVDEILRAISEDGS